jgi:hypothetical protein
MGRPLLGLGALSVSTRTNRTRRSFAQPRPSTVPGGSARGPPDGSTPALLTRRGQPLELFFPARGVSAATMARVRSVCAGCSVRSECLNYATTTVETMGIWAGTTERGRRKLRVVA